MSTPSGKFPVHVIFPAQNFPVQNHSQKRRTFLRVFSDVCDCNIVALFRSHLANYWDRFLLVFESVWGEKFFFFPMSDCVIRCQVVGEKTEQTHFFNDYCLSRFQSRRHCQLVLSNLGQGILREKQKVQISLPCFQRNNFF